MKINPLKEWIRKVKKKDNYTCQYCNKKVEGHNCQAHHVLPKAFKETKLDLKNGIVLCFLHHHVGKYSAHQNALWFASWFKKKFPSRYKYLMVKNNG